VIIQGVTLVSDDEYNGNGIVTGGKAKVSIIESTFKNLSMGIYFNPGTSAQVIDNEFINIKKAVGVDTDKTVTIIGNTGTNVDIGIEDFRSTVVERDNNWGMERAKALTLTANSTEDELDNTPIDTAIQEAIATKEGVAVSQDGTDLPAAGTYWVTQMDMDALDAAIANAEAAKESAKTQQDVTNIVEELEAAVSTFNDAKQEVIDEEEIGAPEEGEEPVQGEEPADDEESVEGEEPEEDEKSVEDEEAVEGEEQEE
jgi:hypothetical protein